MAKQVRVADSEAEERKVKNDNKGKVSKMRPSRDEVPCDPDEICRRGQYRVLRVRKVRLHLLS